MINETKRKATWKELADRVDELQEKLDNSINKDKLIEIIDFAINATDSTDDYSIGLCNGMIYVKALLTDGNPDYKKRQNNEEEKTYEFGLIVGTKREREYWKNKIREKIDNRISTIENLLDEMVDKSIGCINVSYLSKKEKEKIILKRNCLTVQKATLIDIKKDLLKEE